MHVRWEEIVCFQSPSPVGVLPELEATLEATIMMMMVLVVAVVMVVMDRTQLCSKTIVIIII